MTASKTRHRRARGGLMSGAKGSRAARRRMPLWQWFVVVPVIALAAAAILFYVYVTFVDPKLAGSQTPAGPAPAPPTSN